MKKIIIGSVLSVAILASSIIAYAGESKTSSRFSTMQTKATLSNNGVSINKLDGYMGENGKFIEREEYISNLEKQVTEELITNEEKDVKIQQYDAMKEYCTKNSAFNDNSISEERSIRGGCH